MVVVTIVITNISRSIRACWMSVLILSLGRASCMVVMTLLLRMMGVVIQCRLLVKAREQCMLEVRLFESVWLTLMWLKE